MAGSSEARGARGAAPTVNVGDGNADIIGVLPRHGGLQGAGFLDKVGRFVRV